MLNPFESLLNVASLYARVPLNRTREISLVESLLNQRTDMHILGLFAKLDGIAQWCPDIIIVCRLDAS